MSKNIFLPCFCKVDDNNCLPCCLTYFKKEKINNQTDDCSAVYTPVFCLKNKQQDCTFCSPIYFGKCNHSTEDCSVYTPICCLNETSRTRSIYSPIYCLQDDQLKYCCCTPIVCEHIINKDQYYYFPIGRLHIKNIDNDSYCRLVSIYGCFNHIPPPFPEVEGPARQYMSDENKCVVCMESVVKYGFSPCGHACMCMDCIEKSSTMTCPICKTKIEGMYQVKKNDESTPILDDHPNWLP